MVHAKLLLIFLCSAEVTVASERLLDFSLGREARLVTFAEGVALRIHNSKLETIRLMPSGLLDETILAITNVVIATRYLLTRLTPGTQAVSPKAMLTKHRDGKVGLAFGASLRFC